VVVRRELVRVLAIASASVLPGHGLDTPL
jgi:hypothetical protein